MRFIFKVLYLFLILCFNGAPLLATGISTITKENGLTSNVVRNIVQDDYGFIWFGTDNGLCRNDGIEIKSYKNTLPGASQFINALCLVSDGLILGTDKGVYYFSFRTEQFQHVASEIKTLVSHAVMDKDGSVWIASREGIYMYIPQSGACKKFETPHLHGGVPHLLITADNQVLLITKHSHPVMARLNKLTHKFEALNIQCSQNYGSLAILQSHDGTIWLGSWEHGLMRFTDEGTFQKIESVGMDFRHIHSLYEYAPDCILVGGDNGLVAFNPHTLQVSRRSDLDEHLPDLRFVYSIQCDREGGIWLGTFYGGVVNVSPSGGRFEMVSKNVISGFCEDTQKRIWVASDDAGLKLYSPREHRYIDYPCSNELSRLNVHALCMRGENLWVGTYAAGIYVLNTHTFALHRYTPTTQNGLTDFSSYAILNDCNNQLWVATMYSLMRYHDATDSFSPVKSFSSMIIDLDEDAQGNLWVSTQGQGLWRLSPGGLWKHYSFSASQLSTISDDQVNCVSIDASGQLWVGTMSGLCRYHAKEDNFERINLNVPVQEVSAILEDAGVLWLASGSGVLRYEQGKKVRRFTHHDGLICDYFQPNAGIKSSDGRIYLGTVRGFNTFYPYQIKTNNTPPKVYFTGLELLGTPVPIGSKTLDCALPFASRINLSSKDNMFSISFAALSLSSPSQNEYAYMLEGFDKQWIYAGGQHKATYTNIPPGHYTFRVKATNNDGVWSEQDASIEVVIHPPFWWSWPAQLLYVLFFSALIYHALRYRRNYVQARQRHELKKQKEQKEKEMREARLSFFTMVAHEIRTPVSLITGPLASINKEQYPAIKDDLSTIERNAHRLLELVGQLLDFRKVEQKRLFMHFAPQNICMLIRGVSERFAPTFAANRKRFVVEFPDENFTAIVDGEAITKVVSNLLTNANKYTKDFVKLRCLEEPDGFHFRIEVSDDGAGVAPEDQERIFEPFYQAQDNKPGTGLGLSIVKDIVNQHGGVITIDSQPGHGATFTVLLPITQKMDNEVAENSDVSARYVVSTTPVKSSASTGQEQHTTRSKPLLLIVDDNNDMLQFLVRSFNSTYQVETAADGIQALEKLNRLVQGPDQENAVSLAAIISDWMMPHMDGAELCRKVRMNPLTCHLPFIMLTAKADNHSKTECMDIGADYYIEKPFDIDYLQACVRNMLDLRRLLSERFSKHPLQPIEEVATNDADRIFLKRLEKLIDDNSSNYELSVNFLAENLGISRSALFVKVRSVTDMTPNEMIKLLRLKKAARLFNEGNYVIGDVSVMVGFDSPAYFARCFAKQFGMRPSAYIQQLQMKA